MKYAAPLWKQYLLVSWRTIVQDWRSPGYIYSKLILVISSSLFIGFSFSNRKITFKVYKVKCWRYLCFRSITTFIDQMLPYFVKHRAVYEVRAPSRTFSWFAFIAGQITSEIPFQIVVGFLISVGIISWIICQC